MKATFSAQAVDGGARAGNIEVVGGSFSTHCFMPVGTRASVQHLPSLDLMELGVEVVLANTYHLMLRPGAEVVRGLGGLGAFAGWDRLTLTDSGGYQIFSLDPRVDDDGAEFRSTYDGSSHRLTPESATEIQADLGADIQMVLDLCPALPAPRPVVREARAREEQVKAATRQLNA